ncbi:MAG: ATP-dependent helicase HrpB, partial [Deltaproteobacteria bacterium]|nr:ATP-dependent helicase HrpB [Deltaproteobacteria bacterium]
LVLDETVRPAEPSAEVSRILADAAVARGAAAFDEPGALATLQARLATIADIDPDLVRPNLDDAGLRETLIAACQGLRSFAELRASSTNNGAATDKAKGGSADGGGLTAYMIAAFDPRLRACLAADAPLWVTLPGGRSVRINYQADQPPWIESRLQDFFGMVKGPEIARGRLPLTLHLLAPNGRAVQVTRDLDSFWRQHYPALRRELGRRYPRHAWPEDGRNATPPPPLPPRRRH